MASSQHPDSPVFRRLFQPALDAFAVSGNRHLCHRISDEDYLAAGVLRCLSDSRTGRDFLQRHGDGGGADLSVDLFFKALQSGRRLKNLASTNAGLAPLMAASSVDPFASIPELKDFAIFAGDGHYHAAVHDKKHLDRSGTMRKEAAGHFFLLDLRTHFLSHLTGAEQGGRRPPQTRTRHARAQASRDRRASRRTAQRHEGDPRLGTRPASTSPSGKR